MVQGNLLYLALLGTKKCLYEFFVSALAPSVRERWSSTGTVDGLPANADAIVAFDVSVTRTEEKNPASRRGATSLANLRGIWPRATASVELEPEEWSSCGFSSTTNTAFLS